MFLTNLNGQPISKRDPCLHSMVANINKVHSAKYQKCPGRQAQTFQVHEDIKYQ